MSKMKKCKVCGQDIAKSAKTCPHCGAKNKPGAFRVFLGTILIFIGIILAISAITGNNTKVTSKSSGQNAVQALNNAASNRKLEEVSAPVIDKGEFGIKTINGQLKNISGKTISYVQITFAIFDKDGSQIGTAVANINDLTADAVWKYSATPLTTKEWLSFKQTEIVSW